MKFYDYPIISKESSLPVFLVSVGLNEWQYHVNCDKGDNYAKALYCTKGSGVLIMNGEKHIINRTLHSLSLPAVRMSIIQRTNPGIRIG